MSLHVQNSVKRPLSQYQLVEIAEFGDQSQGKFQQNQNIDTKVRHPVD